MTDEPLDKQIWWEVVQACSGYIDDYEPHATQLNRDGYRREPVLCARCSELVTKLQRLVKQVNPSDVYEPVRTTPGELDVETFHVMFSGKMWEVNSVSSSFDANDATLFLYHTPEEGEKEVIMMEMDYDQPLEGWSKEKPK